MSDLEYPVFSVFAFVGFVLVLIPLPWHLQAWNSGTCLYMIWTALGLLNLFVNSIVWHNNVINWAPVWCDISSRLIVGISVAIPAASLCINRRLYKIASATTVTSSKTQRRHAIMVDLMIGIGIPVLQMILQFIVEGHRFNIFENLGCYPYTYNTPPAYPLSIIWPTLIGLTSGVYCCLTLRAFMKRRLEFREILASSPSLTINRYFRLMALATLDLLFTTPISAYGIYLSVNDSPMEPWISFANVHFNYSRVDQFPSVIWEMNYADVVSVELTRWSLVFCALIFFAFFGFAEEARKHYRKAYNFIRGRVAMPPSRDIYPSMKHKVQVFPDSPSVGSLPLYVVPSDRATCPSLDLKVEKHSSNSCSSRVISPVPTTVEMAQAPS